MRLDLQEYTVNCLEEAEFAEGSSASPQHTDCARSESWARAWGRRWAEGQVGVARLLQQRSWGARELQKWGLT